LGTNAEGRHYIDMYRKIILGSSSQIAQYLDPGFKKINSRNFDWQELDGDWDLAILAFGENRKFLDSYDFYHSVNVSLTLQVLDFLKSRAKKIIVFSTCELWNKYSGPIDLNTPFNFYDTFYARSKFEITRIIRNNKSNYQNVSVVYPFNFNSIHRSEDFLFGKIFNSILYKKKIEIGDTYYYRDIFHPTFIVKKLEYIEQDEIIGSGRLTHVNDFIRDLYRHFGLDYESLVTEKLNSFKEFDVKYEYYLRSTSPYYNYESLITDTVGELQQISKGILV